MYDLAAKSHEVDCRYQNQTYRVYQIAGYIFCVLLSSDYWDFIAELREKILDSVFSMISPSFAPPSSAPLTFPHLVKLFQRRWSSEKDEVVSFVGCYSGRYIVLAVTLKTLRTNPVVKKPSEFDACRPGHRFPLHKLEDSRNRDTVLFTSAYCD